MFYLFFSSIAGASGPRISSNIRNNYLTGHPITIQIEFRNTGSSPIKMPNIEAESWRIQFQLEDKNGGKQTRGTRPDKLPSPSFWELEPRQSRQIWVEIPGSSALRSGDYALSFSLSLDNGSQNSITHSIKIKDSQLVAADLTLHQHPLSHASNPGIWVNKTDAGYDTYLHHSDINNHDKELYHDFAVHTEDKVVPRLSMSQGGTRHIAWQSDPRQINYQTFQNNQPRGALQHVALPWPNARLLGSPVTHTDGSIQFLLWIPSPKTGGELRWCQVENNGVPTYRKMMPTQNMPAKIAISMTDLSDAIIAFIDNKKLSVYSSSQVQQRDDLPMKGKLLVENIGANVLDMKFDVHPEEGQVLQLLIKQDDGGLRQDSYSLGGQLVSQIQIHQGPVNNAILAYSPNYKNPAVVIRKNNDAYLLVNLKERAITLPDTLWTLDRHQNDSLWIHTAPHVRKGIKSLPLLE